MVFPDSDFSEVDFYAAAVRVLQQARIEFRVGGAYALRRYTGVFRDTKDFDIFVRPSDVERALKAFHAAGYRAEVTFAHWLAKAHHGEAFIDLIFSSGNGACPVDDAWFRKTEEVTLLGEKVLLVPAEEMIWQKAYIQERERFDGADIAHLIRFRAAEIDWAHLGTRFGENARVLLAHLILFGFIYPGDRQLIPAAFLQGLLEKMQGELGPAETKDRVCKGTLLSRAQYLPDIERWGYTDARGQKPVMMTENQIEAWTDAIGKERAWA